MSMVNFPLGLDYLAARQEPASPTSNPPAIPSHRPSTMHRLIPHQLVHQIRKRPILLHQLRRRTHKPIRDPLHAAKKPILKHIIRLIHPISNLHRKPHHVRLLARRRRNLRHDDRQLRMQAMHTLDLPDRRIAVLAVVVHTKIIGRGAGDSAHEVGEPGAAGVVAGAGGADELVALAAEREYLGIPDVGGLLRGDAAALGLVEEVDDAVLGALDGGPVVAGEIAEAADHGAEGGAAFELGGRPGVPVAEGVDGAVEVHLV